MKLLSNLLAIVIIVGIAIFVQHKFFPRVIKKTVHTSDTIWQDTGSVVKVPKPYPVYRDTGSVQIIKLPADSAAIAKAYLKLHEDFYSTYFYKDTLVDDSTMFIELGAKITQNKPIEYKTNWIDRTPSVINRTTVIHSQNEFYIGLGGGYQKTSINLLFKSKEGFIFTGGYDPIHNKIEGAGYIQLNKLKIW